MDQVEQVGALGLVEPERASERFQYAVGDTAGVTTLETGVVVDADPGEQRDFLPAQPDNAPVAAVGGQSRVLGVILARREVRKSRISVRLSTTMTLRARGRRWETLPLPGSTAPKDRRRRRSCGVIAWPLSG
jgi:hypothetical protein